MDAVSYSAVRRGRVQELPSDWQCPVCGADKKSFKQKELVVAGFAENQSYGLGVPLPSP